MPAQSGFSAKRFNDNRAPISSTIICILFGIKSFWGGYLVLNNYNSTSNRTWIVVELLQSLSNQSDWGGPRRILCRKSCLGSGIHVILVAITERNSLGSNGPKA